MKSLLRVYYSPIARDIFYIGLVLTLGIDVWMVFISFRATPGAEISSLVAIFLTPIILVATLVCAASLCGGIGGNLEAIEKQ